MQHLKLISTVITEATERNPTIEVTHHQTRRHLIIITISETTSVCASYRPQLLVAAAKKQPVDITGSIQGVD